VRSTAASVSFARLESHSSATSALAPRQNIRFDSVEPEVEVMVQGEILRRTIRNLLTRQVAANRGDAEGAVNG
jgi:hypothetical protein